MRLTVAIPTFNRSEYLKRNLPSLLTQLTDDCGVVIVDNCSDEPVAEAVRSILDQFPKSNVRLVRNKTNVGGGQNILRCFEECESEWIWLLGDDDEVCPGAIETILKDVSEHSDSIFGNYCSPRFTRSATFVTRGLNEFVGRLDSYSNALFMSVGVYRRDAILPNIRFGNLYAYSWAPHFAIVLSSLGSSGTAYFSKDPLIKDMSQVPAEAQWSQITTMLGRSALLDLPMTMESRKTLAKKIADKPALEYAAVVLIMMGLESGDSGETCYVYDQICSRLYYFDRRWSKRIRIWFYRWLVGFPSIGLAVVRGAFRVLKGTPFVRSNELSNIVVTNRFTRI